MSHYAKIENDLVVEVIVAEQDFINTLSGEWVQTSYNTQGGVHRLGGTPLRKNYAGVGYTYDRWRDAFVPPKPFDSWVLDENTCQWIPPVSAPQDPDKYYYWSESTLSWLEENTSGNIRI